MSACSLAKFPLHEARTIVASFVYSLIKTYGKKMYGTEPCGSVPPELKDNPNAVLFPLHHALAVVDQVRMGQDFELSDTEKAKLSDWKTEPTADDIKRITDERKVAWETIEKKSIYREVVYSICPKFFKGYDVSEYESQHLLRITAYKIQDEILGDKESRKKAHAALWKDEMCNFAAYAVLTGLCPHFAIWYGAFYTQQKIDFAEPMNKVLMGEYIPNSWDETFGVFLTASPGQSRFKIKTLKEIQVLVFQLWFTLSFMQAADRQMQSGVDPRQAIRSYSCQNVEGYYKYQLDAKDTKKQWKIPNFGEFLILDSRFVKATSSPDNLPFFQTFLTYLRSIVSLYSRVTTGTSLPEQQMQKPVTEQTEWEETLKESHDPIVIYDKHWETSLEEIKKWLGEIGDTNNLDAVSWDVFEVIHSSDPLDLIELKVFGIQDPSQLPKWYANNTSYEAYKKLKVESNITEVADADWEKLPEKDLFDKLEKILQRSLTKSGHDDYLGKLSATLSEFDWPAYYTKSPRNMAEVKLWAEAVKEFQNALALVKNQKGFADPLGEMRQVAYMSKLRQMSVPSEDLWGSLSQTKIKNFFQQYNLGSVQDWENFLFIQQINAFVERLVSSKKYGDKSKLEDKQLEAIAAALSPAFQVDQGQLKALIESTFAQTHLTQPMRDLMYQLISNMEKATHDWTERERRAERKPSTTT